MSCLMSMESGQPILLCDSMLLTTERTAGTTALAVELLSKPESNTLVIIGSGAVALAHWKHVSQSRGWTDVRLWSPSLKDNADKRQIWSNACSDLTFSESAEAAATGADVILLCTSSGVPVLNTDVLNNDALVTSISTNVMNAHEVSTNFLNHAQVYCDYRATTPDNAGEMIIAKRDRNWNTDNVVGDLPELVTGKCPMPEQSTPVFFRSLGLG